MASSSTPATAPAITPATAAATAPATARPPVPLTLTEEFVLGQLARQATDAEDHATWLLDSGHMLGQALQQNVPGAEQAAMELTHYAWERHLSPRPLELLTALANIVGHLSSGHIFLTHRHRT